MPWGLGWFSTKSIDGDNRTDEHGGTRGSRKSDATLTDDARRRLSRSESLISPAAAAAAASGVFGLWAFYRRYLRRIPVATHVAPGYFRRRSLLGQVTSVGDGDGFRLFHTPGGRLAGWGWLRRVPTGRKELKEQTISVRLAGVDAPELAHFGRPAQPFAAEAQAFLENLVLNRPVRVYIYRRDQYERVLATAYVRRPPLYFPRRDVGMELLRAGLATTYEARIGAEFGKPGMEAKYRAAEEAARKRGKGLWSVEKGSRGFLGIVGRKPGEEVETPMAFKRRHRLAEGEVEAEGKTGTGA